MLGINYESSDEEDPAPAPVTEVSRVIPIKRSAIATNIKLLKSTPNTASSPKPAAPKVEEPSITAKSSNQPDEVPTASIDASENQDLADDVPPGSPYTSNRLQIQNLTLPSIPNFDIPPSPPGSPPQPSSKKFAQFLTIKSKGQHFNQRLEQLPALRDPSHLPNLLDFAGVSKVDSYASTLSDALGVPSVWPSWAYGDKLDESQKRLSKSSKEGRTRVDFVPAQSGDSTIERAKTDTEKQTMSASAQSMGKRKDLEYRESRGVPSGSRLRSRSRSPKRRKSRSRERR
jgi:hypothetical protein